MRKDGICDELGFRECAKGFWLIQKQGKIMGMVLEGVDGIDLARREQAEGRMKDLNGGFD